MVGVVGIIIKINSFFFQKPPGYETVSVNPLTAIGRIFTSFNYGNPCCNNHYPTFVFEYFDVVLYHDTVTVSYKNCNNFRVLAKAFCYFLI